MKNTFFAFFFVLCYTFSFAQNNHGKIVIGKIDTIESTILGEKRQVWVYVPNAGPADIYAQARYPVVYLLDGDAHFYSIVGMIQQFSQINGNDICPEMIVVGIPNTNRFRDLTPSKDTMSPDSGGGENFMSFMEKELMPYIEATYPTQPYKMFIGHSLGGLMVMNSVVNHTKLFNSYICIDPSMWYDNQNLLTVAKNSLPVKDLNGTSLYVGIANTLSEEMDINSVKKDTSRSSNHIRSILEMDDFIKAIKPKGLHYASKYYEDDTHGSVPLITEYDGLRFIFEKYPLKLVNKDWEDSTSLIVEKFVKHYQGLSHFFGYEVKPPENQTNAMGYQFLNDMQFKKAKGFFEMNVENYPESSNVYDSYGDYFVAIGDKANAILQFKKALSIKENPESRKKLDSLLD